MYYSLFAKYFVPELKYLAKDFNLLSQTIISNVMCDF